MALSPEKREERRDHLVRVAQVLIREGGDAGFSMAQLAARAGVSPATPYNLIGPKPEVLRLVVREEFQSFAARLRPAEGASPLAVLLAAADQVVDHYLADRPFYRGLYHAAGNTEAREVHDLMLDEGRALWRGLVGEAIASGELEPWLRREPFTDQLLRILSGVTLSWLSGDLDDRRFAPAMGYSVRLALAGAASASARGDLTLALRQLQSRLDTGG